jgi:hypothetical protein
MDVDPKKVIEAVLGEVVTVEHAAKNSITDDDWCGIYLVIKGDDVIYVGQSKNCAVRAPQSVMARGGDSWFFIKCKENQLDLIETAYIELIKPAKNGVKKVGPRAGEWYSPMNRRDFALAAALVT